MSNAKSVFLQAIEIDDPTDREAYVDEECQGDSSLREEVVRLLNAARGAGDFMAEPALNLGETATLSPIAERPGAQVGPYKLMEQIGEGGFGLVFLAIQEQPVRRKVALKIIKPGMDSREVIARFEAERQALALMDHPNIAKVFDAGATAATRPYFVMELVRGVPITTYCDQHLLSSRERLDLFLSVCMAIQHAHQKGIIHRDVKPSNILVTLHDGQPLVKVIDFGVAKALSQKLTDQTLYTRFAQMLGTPLYMSPEQADMSGQDIDTRSDIYSLGVLLYELLTGTTPFNKKRLQGIAATELRRILCEEEPPKPSTRLSQSGDQLPSIAALRNTEPAKLSKLVRGDLDWIVMKCLDKDRKRRYETANALARDVQRFMHDEPVHACPPSASYRFRKFARRYRKPLLAASLVAMALVCGTAVSIWQAVRAVRAERSAIAERDAGELARQEAIRGQEEAEQARAEEARSRRQAEKVTDFLVSTFQSPHPLREGSEITVAEVLDHGEEQLEEDLADEPLTQAALLDAIGRSRTSLGLSTSSIKSLARAYDIRRQELGSNHADTLATLDGLASAYRASGLQQKAIKLYEDALATRRAHLGSDHPDTLASLRNLANIYHAVGRREEALSLYQESLELAGSKQLSSSEDMGDSLAFKLDAIEAQQSREAARLRDQMLQHGFFAASAGLASRVSAEAVNEVMDVAMNFHGELTPGALDAVVLGELRQTAGQMEAAEDAFRTALGMGEMRPFVYKSLGWCLLAQGKENEAKENFEKALATYRQSDGKYDLSQADPDEMTAAYFLDLVTEKEYTDHTADDERLACFPWFYVAQRREIEGNQEAAIAAYRRSVELGENETAHPVLGQARWRLEKLLENVDK
ncbi:serine/threonine-protein kinase [Bythopirellula goksoeyrii]|uniref:Serine/threonine-protein kinase Pkn1 n=1 Tax=Bythopirellula goksoeyrii TaxID=1400387 RepID=A0A5B9QGI2_9BACT|nr:serine/threonine-protein kinase [Bythopirellula goksoeyrii]QEG37019.1 Serine/threonine-protein kinase Pkn1 [Bythopirellula goksoeyrii]